METLKTSETLIEGLATSKQCGNGNLAEGSVKSFDLGEEKCDELVSVPVAEKGCIDPRDSSSHASVHIKGISLFVELTGGLSNDVSEHGLSNQGEVTVANEEFQVNVGDFVWAKQKFQSWWPGIVCDPSTAPNEDGNVQKMGDLQETEEFFLVKCFGNGNYIWCLPDEVKPFVEYYEQVSKQRKTKLFSAALEEAVVKVGLRVKTDFTCSCFSERSGDVDDHSVTHIEPATFLDYITNLATDSSSPSKIDLTINHNFLSAFNRSLGHHQIPIDQLRSPSKIEEENGVFNEDVIKGSDGKSEKKHETRGRRRKSRFLSYPGEEGMEDENGGMDLSQSNGQPVKKSKKKWSKKIVVKHEKVEANICSSEVLYELQCAGQDCLFPCESKNFDSVQRFISEFRKWAFGKFTNGIVLGLESVNGMHTHQIFRESEKGVGTEKTKKVRKKKIKSDPLIIDFKNSSSLTHEPQSMVKGMETLPMESNSNGNCNILNFGTEQPLCKLFPKKRKKNVDKNTPVNVWNGNLSLVPNSNGHMDPFLFHSVPQNVEGLNQTDPFDFTEIGSALPWFGAPTGSNDEPKKRGRKRKNMDLQTDSISEVKKGKRVKKKEEIGTPCIDLNYIKLNQETPEVKGTAFLLKFSSQHPLPSTQNLNFVFSKYGPLHESETHVSIENLSAQVVFSDSNSAGGAFWGLQNDQPFGPALVNYRIQHLTGDSTTESLETFKTPIKTQPLNQEQEPNSRPYIIPDLNGYAEETKTKKPEEIRLQPPSGTALLLKFSPDHPLPTSEYLNSVFCKYGSLNGSETWVSGQDLMGQVVFVNPWVAGEAVRGLETDRPFGKELLSYRVQHLYSVKPAIEIKDLKRVEVVGGDVGVIRKNLEMMRVMLEKAGDGLSPEMRGKLESEIRGLMKKVESMDGGGGGGGGGCSSSCL